MVLFLTLFFSVGPSPEKFSADDLAPTSEKVGLSIKILISLEQLYCSKFKYNIRLKKKNSIIIGTQ